MKNKNAKQVTFDLLDESPPGTTFTGYGLMDVVNSKTGRRMYPDTLLRYMREWRRETGREVENINKAKSLYRVAG